MEMRRLFITTRQPNLHTCNLDTDFRELICTTILFKGAVVYSMVVSNVRPNCGLALRRRRRLSTKMNSGFLLVASHVTLLAVVLLAAVAAASQDQTASNDVIRRPFSCPNDCQCKKAQTVDCRGIGISNITGVLSQQAAVVKL